MHSNGHESRTPLNLLPFRRKPVEQEPSAPIIGFAGMWILLDEAHITTIGVSPNTERRIGQSKMGTHVIAEAIVRPWGLLGRRVARVISLR